jgi:hypothetical protein
VCLKEFMTRFCSGCAMTLDGGPGKNQQKYSGFIEHYSLPHKCVSMGLRPWALTTPLTKNKPNIRQSVFPNNQSKVQLFLQVDPVAKA